MIRVTASEFAKNFGKYREAALQEPIAVTAHDRVTGYYISAKEYERYEDYVRHSLTGSPAVTLSERTVQDIARAVAAFKGAPKSPHGIDE